MFVLYAASQHGVCCIPTCFSRTNAFLKNTRFHVRRIRADCESRTAQQHLCAPCCAGASITRAAPHCRSRQDRAQRGPAGEHAVRFSAQPPARTRRPFCSFESVSLEPAMPFEATERHCTQRYSVQFPNGHTAVLTAHALLTVWHAALAGRAHSHFRQNRFLRCCSIASSTARNAVQRCGGRRG